MEHKSSSVAHSDYSKVLYAVATVLPQGVEVLFLADRGFADLHLLKQLRRLNWHYRIRIKSSFYLYLGKHGQAISHYHLRPGEALFLRYVYLTRQRYGFVHVALERRSPNQKGSNGGTVEVLLSERSHAPSILESSCGVVGNRAEGCQPD